MHNPAINIGINAGFLKGFMSIIFSLNNTMPVLASFTIQRKTVDPGQSNLFDQCVSMLDEMQSGRQLISVIPRFFITTKQYSGLRVVKMRKSENYYYEI